MSHDLGAELRMHSFTVECDAFLNEEKVAVASATSVEVICSEAMLALSFFVLLYFVGNVYDEKTGKVITRVNGWQYFRWMSI